MMISHQHSDGYRYRDSPARTWRGSESSGCGGHFGAGCGQAVHSLLILVCMGGHSSGLHSNEHKVLNSKALQSCGRCGRHSWMRGLSCSPHTISR